MPLQYSAENFIKSQQYSGPVFPMTSTQSFRLIPISGVASKSPACFLVEIGGKRILCDLGAGPDKGVIPAVEKIGAPVDMLLLSHQHADHLGALDLLDRVGRPPVYATAPVAEAVTSRQPLDCRPLPFQGTTDLGGVTLVTGRSGHAPGGVWLHLTAGRQQFLYMGDHSADSLIYAQDIPPQADLMVVDASYGDDETPLSERLREHVEALTGKAALMPAPAPGRGPEIAYGLWKAGLPAPALCASTRRTMEGLVERHSACLLPGVAAAMAELLCAAPAAAGPDRLTLAAPATLEDGPSAKLYRPWLDAGQPVVFTGYVAKGTPAKELVESGRAKSLRWKVHPGLSENAALLKAVRPRIVVPAFADGKYLATWRKAFAPAEVRIDGPVDLA
jgi:Cft2 family RNA processing exonuclease